MFLKIIFGIKQSFRIFQGNQDGNAEKYLPNVIHIIFKIFQKKGEKNFRNKF